MKQTVATAAATAAAVMSSLLSMIPSPQAAAPAFVVFSIPQVLEARSLDAPTTSPAALQQATTTGSDISAVKAAIARYARKYGVNEGIMTFVVDCETAGTFDPSIQSRHILPDGSREQSFGLAQINLPANPEISLAQAKDPDFSLDFLARALSKGEFWRWSCLVR